MTSSASCSRSALLLLLLLATVACDAASSDADTGPATFGPATDGGSSGGASSTSAATDDPTTEGTTSSSDTDPSTTDEPISCNAPLQACGVQCVDTLSDVTNCGACGISCIVPNAEAACVDGGCSVAGCDDGWSDCDGDPDNGCEAESTCQEGIDCMTTCGSTGTVTCNASCEAVCNLPAETCNAVDDDCNGSCDEGLADCRVAVHRGNGGQGHFYTTDLAEAQAYGLEAADFYFLYLEQETGLQPFFRCLKPNNRYLYTTSTNCEGLGAPQLTVGFISPVETCGAIPLYRAFSGAAGNHFYTVSAPERDNAVANLGYVDEGVAGWVWSGG